MRFIPGRRFAAVTLFIMMCTASSAVQARWMAPDRSTPVERLITNVAAHVAKHPDDAAGHYTLGRLHSLAWAQEATPGVYKARGRDADGEALPTFPAFESIVKERAEGKIDDDALKHLGQSIKYYTRALELDPDNDLYALGLAWMLEQGAPHAVAAGFPWIATLPPRIEGPERERLLKVIARLGEDEETARAAASQFVAGMDVIAPLLREVAAEGEQPAAVQARLEGILRDLWLDRALRIYRRTFAVAAPADNGQMHMRGVPIVSVELGQGIVRILNSRKKSTAEQEEVDYVSRGVKRIDSSRGPVTPIILPLGDHTSLSSLLSPHKRVRFDLAGDSGGDAWPWVTSDAGILVWDPEGSGNITSGRQLFGSVTWWIFWKNGYDALAALDDDHNGWLEGRELNGIRVWRDANGDGASQAAEVQSLDTHGIVGLAVKSMGATGDMPANARGVRLIGGGYRPSYDWTPLPWPAGAPASH